VCARAIAGWWRRIDLKAFQGDCRTGRPEGVVPRGAPIEPDAVDARASPPRVGNDRVWRSSSRGAVSVRLRRDRVSKGKVSTLMANAIAQFSAGPGRAGRRVLVFAVLLGLFLMHGMSASADAACAIPASTQITASSVDQTAVPMQTAIDKGVSAGSDASTLSADSCACDHAMSSCTPLAGRDHGALFGALLLALSVVPALPLGPSHLAAARARRSSRGGAAAAVLDLACVSRT